MQEFDHIYQGILFLRVQAFTGWTTVRQIEHQSDVRLQVSAPFLLMFSRAASASGGHASRKTTFSKYPWQLWKKQHQNCIHSPRNSHDCDQPCSLPGSCVQRTRGRRRRRRRSSKATEAAASEEAPVVVSERYSQNTAYFA